MPNKIGLIGGGNMGEAIIHSVSKKYVCAVVEKDAKRVQYLRKKYSVRAGDLKSVVALSDFIIVAVKPQDIDDVLKRLSFIVTSKHLIVSIAAGITIGYIEKLLGGKIKVIRTMPNMPAMIGQGMTAVAVGRFVKPSDVKAVCTLFDYLGKTVVVKENLMDAVTAVSGSGPAYLFLFMECLMNAAKDLGLSDDLSRLLVETTLQGSIHLVQKQKADPAELRAKVTSKGGTTQAALEIFEKHKFGGIISEALQAAQRRAGELARK